MSGKPGRQIFRQAALDRLSSPEQLDQYVAITDPRGWIALSMFVVLLVAILGWAFLGEIPDQVEGVGILVGQGGRVVDVASPAAGNVTRIMVNANDRVKVGQQVATIDQEALREKLQGAIQSLKELRDERSLLAKSFSHEVDLQTRNAKEQVSFQQQIISAAKQRADYLAQSLKKQQRLATTGVISRDRLEQVRNDYNSTRQEISAAQIRILQLQSDAVALKSRQSRQLNAADQRVAAAQRRVRELSTRLKTASRIVAPVSGRVTELKTFPGDTISAGQPLLSIESAGHNLEAVLYVPTADGKRISRGMSVRVEPATVHKEEYGTILGKVAKVSDFPVTRAGMLAVLQNENLVRNFSVQGAPYAARVSLERDSKTPSGYRWTSATGPAIDITSGTTIKAEITVRERAPIDLVIPFIRKQTGIGFLAGHDR